MNIFVLDLDPELCAQYHCDKHVVKMVSEYGQLLSTAHWILSERMDGLIPGPSEAQRLFKPAYRNHPSAIWARECGSNYEWLYELFCATAAEFVYRYRKPHMTFLRLKHVLAEPPVNIAETSSWNRTEFPQCMPDHNKTPDTVTAYRNYYWNDKFPIITYKRRHSPDWLAEKIQGAL